MNNLEATACSLQVTPERCTLLDTVNFLGKTRICQLSQEGRQAGIAKQINFLPKTHFQFCVTRI
jgi:predicted nucleotidyltransferase